MLLSRGMYGKVHILKVQYQVKKKNGGLSRLEMFPKVIKSHDSVSLIFALSSFLFNKMVMY